jgi:type IV secretion system protein VirB2
MHTRLVALRTTARTESDPWPQPDQPPPFRPPEPQPYERPDRPPGEPPPFRPPDAPPFDRPDRNPWGLGFRALAGAGLALVVLPGLAHAAAAGGGGGLPWDSPLQTLQTDLTGSTATAISLIGVVAIFAVLIFGGELNHFFRSMCYVIMLVAVLVAGQNLLSDLGITGAVVNSLPFWPMWLSSAALAGATAVIMLAVAMLGYFAGRAVRARRMRRRIVQ